jgi:hypothetical protein
MNNPSGKGYGGWESRSVGSIIAQVVDDAVKHADKIGLAADAIHDGVSTLLTTHKFGTPKEGVDPSGWDWLKHHLAVWIEIMAAEYPYTIKQYPFGRGYIPHGSGNWMTYLASERQVTHVTNYQWSAPGEWFAELYAICWYDPDKAPPSGVAAAVRAFLPGGDGAGNPDAAAH